MRLRRLHQPLRRSTNRVQKLRQAIRRIRATGTVSPLYLHECDLNFHRTLLRHEASRYYGVVEIVYSRYRKAQEAENSDEMNYEVHLEVQQPFAESRGG